MGSQLLVSLSTMGGLGLILSIGLVIADKKLNVEEDPLTKEIVSVLPGLNCGACGFPSCQAYAEQVARAKAGVGCCVVGGEDIQSKLAAIMTVEFEKEETEIAAVRCQGGEKECKRRFRYQGVLTCRANNLLNGGDKACVYGCLGLGDCVRVCPFEAIELNDNSLPMVKEHICTGCGLCVKACPRDVIYLIPQSQKIYLGCMSQDKAMAVKEICTIGCFACTLCATPKVTPGDLIVMQNNLPLIRVGDIRDWKALDQAVAKCPAKCFVLNQGARSMACG